MESDKNNKLPKKYEREPFEHLMRTMNDFFNEKPFKRLYETVEDMFQMPFPFQSIPIDMDETENYMIINAELPGVKREQIKIDWVGNQLTISVDHSEEIKETNDKEQAFRKNKSYTHSSKTISLPYPIPEKNIKAAYRDGLLEIRIPKQKSKRISIDDSL